MTLARARCRGQIWHPSPWSRGGPDGGRVSRADAAPWRSVRRASRGLVYPGLNVPFILAHHVLRGVGVGGEPHRCARRRVPAHLHDVELAVGAGPVGVLRGVFLARHPRGHDQPAVGLQDRRADRAGAGLGRRTAVHPGEQPARVRAVPRRLVRAGRRAVDPRDLGQPVRHRDGPRGERDAAAQPRPGVQPGRGEHRRAARRGADPAADHVRGRQGEHDRGAARQGARSTICRWCSGPTSASPACSC